jgi:hypothetical protein
LYDIFTPIPNTNLMTKWVLLVIAFCWVQEGLSQPKTLTAVKTQQAIIIDGKMEDAWQTASVANSFIQNYPGFGQPASVETEVRFLYDDNAIYIHAYLHDNPSLIRKQITARDGEQRQDVDYFSVAFDTYNDQQNGFLFLVTPTNVQTDSKITLGSTFSYGSIGSDSRSWDAVWQSSVEHTSDGWEVEMRIPYISLRFAKKDVQTWGLQFVRFTRRNNEAATWNPVNPNQSGFINQFGKCENLVDIKPPLRLSFSPYVTGGVRFYPEGNEPKREFLRNGGMDVKYGINESFTLDATLIPDFGQVISDNLINNLTPFEVRFTENRPFFTEGTELFNKAELFYSRRIGAIPANYYSVEGLRDKYTILENPSVTQLYNAVKLSGRTKNKLGIGVFNAVTAPMHADVRNEVTGKDSSIETESLTNYNLFVLDQALRGRSSITFTNTNVIRSGSARDANVTGLDYNYFTKNNTYQLKLSGRYSTIHGYTPYESNINLIDDTTRINGQLMVRPYDGSRSTISFNKVSGKIQFRFSTNISTHTYDPNDMGYLQRANEVSYAGLVSYNQLTATDKFITYKYEIGSQYFSLYKPYAYNSVEFYAKGFWLFKNFWDFNLSVGSQPFGQNDYFELRTPNRYLQRPAFHYISFGGSSDSRKKLYAGGSFGYAHTEIENGDYFSINFNARHRFSNRFSLSIDINNQDDQTQVGYAFQREANGEPIIGYRRFLETQSVLSGIYNFTSRLNLTLRARHYWNEVKYKSFFDVAPDGSHIKRAFINNQDENYNLFNLDGFLTWDFRLGSRLIVGYKNWLGNPYAVVGQRNYFDNLKDIFSGSHGNELTAKFIYFLNYNQLRKKH